MNVTSVVRDRLVCANTVMRNYEGKNSLTDWGSRFLRTVFTVPLYQAIRRHIKKILYYNSIIILVGGAGIA
jgi:hypothetical protein